MKIAIMGGTGFVGRHLAQVLASQGHEVLLIARGVDRRDTSVLELPGVRLVAIGLDDVSALTEAFAGVDAVAHCAGINRELGAQTYERVHVQGTRHVVEAASSAGVRKIALVSFLRARPQCGSPYHESKWAAEEIVRASGLDYTILKCGVIYGRGDHMLDHLRHAFHTFPVFGLVGLRDQRMRPVAVEDVARILAASLTEERLSRGTYWVTGPEELTLAAALRRVASVVEREPLWVRLPIPMHALLTYVWEWTMRVPLVSRAQLRILSEGIVDPWPPCDSLPGDLLPQTPFSPAQIRRSLPAPGPFGRADLRCCTA